MILGARMLSGHWSTIVARAFARTYVLDRVRCGRRCLVESVVVEIRAAEGGEDARLLVDEQFAIYAKLGARRGL